MCEGVCVTAGWVLMNHFLKIVFSAGDVSPISMSPISQSQFIPLGEILCLAISAMNSARKPVTQEALMEHLTTCFPGKREKNEALSKGMCVPVVLRLDVDSSSHIYLFIYLFTLKMNFRSSHRGSVVYESD